MSRRVSLPGADELFRSTSDAAVLRPEPQPPSARVAEPGVEQPRADVTRLDASRSTMRSRPTVPARHDSADRRPTGREKHEQKITVYCSEDELIDLEHARLALRRENGIAVDRGRIVREAVSLILADLEAKGEDSILVRRLRGR
ncbi:MAG: hypothetical protein QOI42_173 [Frankiaceae bacterium]|nr:hypothetical protein [Frankiaceae bacterium]